MNNVKMIQEEFKLHRERLEFIKDFILSKKNEEELGSEEEEAIELVNEQLELLEENEELIRKHTIKLETHANDIANITYSLVYREIQNFITKMLENSSKIFKHVILKGNGFSSFEIINFLKNNLKIKILTIEYHQEIDLLINENFYHILNLAPNLCALEFQFGYGFSNGYLIEPCEISEKLSLLNKDRNIIIDCFFYPAEKYDKYFYFYNTSNLEIYKCGEPVNPICKICLTPQFPSSESMEFEMLYIKNNGEKNKNQLEYRIKLKNGEEKNGVMFKDLHEKTFDNIDINLTQKIKNIICEIISKEHKLKFIENVRLSQINRITFIKESNGCEIHFDIHKMNKLSRDNYKEIISNNYEGIKTVLMGLFSHQLSNKMERQFNRIMSICKKYIISKEKKERLLDIFLAHKKGIIESFLNDEDKIKITFIEYKEDGFNFVIESINTNKILYEYIEKNIQSSKKQREVYYEIEPFRYLMNEIISIDHTYQFEGRWRLIDYIVCKNDVFSASLLCINNVNFDYEVYDGENYSEGMRVVELASKYATEKMLHVLLDIPIISPEEDISLLGRAYDAVFPKDLRKSPLFYACEGGKEENVKFFIRSGVKINQKFNKNYVIDVAYVNGYFNLMILLLDHGSRFPKNITELGDSFAEKKINAIISERNRIKGYIIDGKKENIIDSYKQNILTRYYVSSKNESALSLAFKSEQYGIYAFLLKNGFSIISEKEEKYKNFLAKNTSKKSIDNIRSNILDFMDNESFSAATFLLSRTRILQFTQERVDYVRQCYESLAKMPEIFIVLKVLEYTDSNLCIACDFNKDNVQDIAVNSGPKDRGLCEHLKGQIFIGCDVAQNELLGTLAHELTHQAMQVVYKNSCKPYFSGNKGKYSELKINEIAKNIKQYWTFNKMSERPKEDSLEQYKNSYILIDNPFTLYYITPNGGAVVVEITDRKKFEREFYKIYQDKAVRLSIDQIKKLNNFKEKHIPQPHKDINSIISMAFNENYEEAGEVNAELIVRVNHMLAKYGEKKGSNLLKEQVPTLYDFYKKGCMIEFDHYISTRKNERAKNIDLSSKLELNSQIHDKDDGSLLEKSEDSSSTCHDCSTQETSPYNLNSKFSEASQLYGIFKRKYRNPQTRDSDETFGKLQEAKDAYKGLFQRELSQAERTVVEKRLAKLKRPETSFDQNLFSGQLHGQNPPWNNNNQPESTLEKKFG